MTRGSLPRGFAKDEQMQTRHPIRIALCTALIVGLLGCSRQEQAAEASLGAACAPAAAGTAVADASPVTGSTYTSSGSASGSTLHAGSSTAAHSTAAAATRSGREAPASRREGKDDDLTG